MPLSERQTMGLAPPIRDTFTEKTRMNTSIKVCNYRRVVQKYIRHLDIWGMSTGIWHLISDIRNLASDIWQLRSDIIHVIFDIRHLILHVWYLLTDIWPMTSDTWHLIYNICHLTADIWLLTSDINHLTFILTTNCNCELKVVVWPLRWLTA